MHTVIHTYIINYVMNCKIAHIRTWNSSDRKSSVVNVVLGYWFLLQAQSMVLLNGRLDCVGFIVSSTFSNSLHSVPRTPLTCINATNNSITYKKCICTKTVNTTTYFISAKIDSFANVKYTRIRNWPKARVHNIYIYRRESILCRIV